MKRGDRVPGSRLFRDWCAGCQEPIRVTAAALDRERNYCLECIPPAPDGDPVKRRGREGAATDRDFHGGQFDRGEW